MSATVQHTTAPNTYDPTQDRWKWVVRGYYHNGDRAFEIVHKDDVSRDVEVRVASGRPDIGRVEVLTWREANCPEPHYR